MSALESRRAALEARLTRGYAWFCAHGYEPSTASGVDAVDGDRQAEKAEATWLELLREYMAVCDMLQAAPLEQPPLFNATARAELGGR